jgi:hypothetical protein
MNKNDKITKLAQRGQALPESLTYDEIRELCLAALCNLNDSGEMLQPEIENLN